VEKSGEEYWMPVDLYVGGSEHSVLHLLYARFWHKVLYDCGVVSTKEPFKKLVHQGMILGEMEYTAYRKNGQYLRPSEAEGMDDVEKLKLAEKDIEKKQEKFVMKGTDIEVDAKAYKMSKSRGNVINPDQVVDQFGADSLRLYEMFMGPLEQVKPWSTKGVEGVYRFLNRVWRLIIDEFSGEFQKNIQDIEPGKEQLKVLHEAIRKVTEDIENMRFNTAISALMIFVNEANQWEKLPVSVLNTFVLLLSPFAPHLAEEMWSRLGNKESLAYEPWPEFSEEYLKEDTVMYPVQINGKVRGEVHVPSDKAKAKDYVLAEARKEKNVQRYLDGTTVVKEIFVPGRIINIVVK
jgi:leucyl-tRNA synthetase